MACLAQRFGLQVCQAGAIMGRRGGKEGSAHVVDELQGALELAGGDEAGDLVEFLLDWPLQSVPDKGRFPLDRKPAFRLVHVGSRFLLQCADELSTLKLTRRCQVGGAFRRGTRLKCCRENTRSAKMRGSGLLAADVTPHGHLQWRTQVLYMCTKLNLSIGQAVQRPAAVTVLIGPSVPDTSLITWGTFIHQRFQNAQSPTSQQIHIMYLLVTRPSV
jgi:hypothetical protein